MDSEDVWENGFEITNRDEQFHVTIRGYQDKRRGEDYFKFLDEAEPTFHLLSSVVLIQQNALSGHRAYYKSGRHTYCEYLFDLKERDGLNGLHIVVFMEKGRGEIFQVALGQIAQDLIASVQSEHNR